MLARPWRSAPSALRPLLLQRAGFARNSWDYFYHVAGVLEWDSRHERVQVFLEIRIPVLVSVAVAVRCVGRVESIGCLPSVGHPVLIGVESRGARRGGQRAVALVIHALCHQILLGLDQDSGLSSDARNEEGIHLIAGGRGRADAG